MTVDEVAVWSFPETTGLGGSWKAVGYSYSDPSGQCPIKGYALCCNFTKEGGVEDKSRIPVVEPAFLRYNENPIYENTTPVMYTGSSLVRSFQVNTTGIYALKLVFELSDNGIPGPACIDVEAKIGGKRLKDLNPGGESGTCKYGEEYTMYLYVGDFSGVQTVDLYAYFGCGEHWQCSEYIRVYKPIFISETK